MRASILASALLLAPSWGFAEFVIDDAELSRSFAEKLGTMVESSKKALDGHEASQELNRCVGKSLPLPDGAKTCAPVAGNSVYARSLPAVVAVGSVYKCGKCEHWHLGGFATGWILSPDGLVMTNFHVLAKDDGNKIGVMTSDGEVYMATEVLAADKDGDAAIFRIDPRGKSLPCLTLGAGAEPGDEVEIISHPKGRFFCLTQGVVSRFHRQKHRGDDKVVWMSVTADFAVGSSGGPVLNSAGQVVGMVSSTLTAQTNDVAKDKPNGPSVQMVFKDCVSLETLRGLVKAPAAR